MGARAIIENRDNADTIRPQWQYWPEIDGLRTVAILSVFVFHFSRSTLPGGLVGVDVFFVISGFLIGSILLNDIAKQKFSIARFYQRRVARIFPPLILVLCATLCTGSLIYSAQDMASLGINSAAAALSLINMKLITQGSYFIASADAQPLLHYWSLAVEEQFYLIFPILLYVLVRYTTRPLAVMLGLAAVSFASCVWLTPSHPTFAFYSLPTRAWELLIGSSLALYRSEGGRFSELMGTLAAWSGAAMIALSLAIIDEQTGFPGWIAALPVLGTAFLIAPSGDGKSIPLRFLAQGWMVAIGRRSYSLYLWHWPVFSFVDYRFFESGSVFRGVVKVAITLALTELSYQFVEKPARSYLKAPVRQAYVFVGAITIITAITVGGVWIRSALYFDVLPATIASGGMVVRGGDRGTIVLSGDSEAAMYGKELASIAREGGFTLYALGTAGKNQLPGEDGTHWPEALKLIADKKPDLVILVDAWAEKLHESAPLRTALTDVLPHARHVLVLLQPPILADDVSRESIRGGLRGPYLEPTDRRRERANANKIVEVMASDRVTVLDVSGIFNAPDGGIAVLAPDHRMAFVDARHLSDSGTAMARRTLEAAIIKAFESAKP